MVVFVDLDDDGDDEALQKIRDTHMLDSNQLRQLRLGGRQPKDAATAQDDDSSSTVNRSAFSAALSCYPIAVSIAAHLDLNDLYSLSRTCRQYRANLLEFHHQLIAHSLRCSFDAQPLLADILATHKTISYAGRHLDPANIPSNVLAAISSAQRSAFTDHLLGAHSRLLKSSKIGKCARDLVAECRKCSKVVCRNCAAKAPSDRYLKDRFRRLCGSCLRAPLEAHTNVIRSQYGIETSDAMPSPPRPSASPTRTLTSDSSSSSSHENYPESTIYDQARLSGSTFAYSTCQRSPCCCATRGVFLCQDCGQNLRAADTTYKRVWTWRSRYSTHIGGLGTGMGAGDQGQKCARGEECLDRMGAGLCWVEIDCCEQQPPSAQHYTSPSLLEHDIRGLAVEDSLAEDSAASADLVGTDAPTTVISNKPGYLRQEIEGIGGVVKKKVKKKVRTGATVWEFDDERESGKYLEREASGAQRSWCGWCYRVVMGEHDRDEHEQS